MNKICVRKSDILGLIVKHKQGDNWVDFDAFYTDVHSLNRVRVDAVNRINQLTEIIEQAEKSISAKKKPRFVHTMEEVAEVLNISRRTLYVWGNSKIISVKREPNVMQLRLVTKNKNSGYDVLNILSQLKKYEKPHK